MYTRCILAGAAVVFLGFITAAVADVVDVAWQTVDCGGGYSAGGEFEVEGTIGQHDTVAAAGSFTGGTFEVVGGFWSVSSPSACLCPGDINGDGRKDGADIQPFITCYLLADGCGCANVDGSGGVDEADLTVFVDDLLTGDACQ